jgi:hypothetical protein
MNKLKLFIELSCILTGEQNLDDQIASSYFEFISNRIGYDFLVTEFLNIKDLPDFDKKFNALITSSSNNKSLVKDIIDIWYLATVWENDGVTVIFSGKSDEYQYSLLYKVIGAHPPGHTFSKAYGHWKNKPNFIS